MIKINWGTAIVIFFAIFLSLATAFIIFALQQNNELVADDYYEQGAHFSKAIEIKKRSIPFKDSIQLYQSNSQINLSICPTIVQKATSYTIQFYCASDKKSDVSFSYLSIADSQNVSKSTLVFDSKKFKKAYYSAKILWWVDSLQFEIDKELLIK